MRFLLPQRVSCPGGRFNKIICMEIHIPRPLFIALRRRDLIFPMSDLFYCALPLDYVQYNAQCHSIPFRSKVNALLVGMYCVIFLDTN